MSDHAEKAQTSPKGSLPAGFKVVIGCLAAFFCLATLAVVVLGVGGMWLKGKADDVIQNVQARADAQQQAGAILDRLRREQAFTAPSDGRIDPASADRFVRAVESAWASLESSIRRLEEASHRARDGEAGIRDVIESVKASGLLVDSRLHIARALDEAGISLEEFVWTGRALRNVRRETSGSDASAGSRPRDAVTRSNIAVAERLRERLSAMDPSSGEASPATVLDLATLWAGTISAVQPPPR